MHMKYIMDRIEAGLNLGKTLILEIFIPTVEEKSLMIV